MRLLNLFLLLISASVLLKQNSEPGCGISSVMSTILRILTAGDDDLAHQSLDSPKRLRLAEAKGLQKLHTGVELGIMAWLKVAVSGESVADLPIRAPESVSEAN